MTAADVIARLEELETSQILLVLQAKDAGNEIKKNMKAKAPTKVDDAKQNQKIGAIQTLVQEALKKMLTSAWGYKAMKKRRQKGSGCSH